MKTTDLEIISRYTNQEVCLPSHLRAHVEKMWAGRSIQLYALIDLNDSLQIEHRWLVLGVDDVALMKNCPEGQRVEVNNIERRCIESIKEQHGLSCTSITFLGGDKKGALMSFRYSHRQRKAVANILFILEQQCNKHPAPISGVDADQSYASSLTHSIRQAQASVAKNQLAVVWRLLSYLKPYRKQVVYGMICASMMTLLGLVPPLLSGRMIDHVIRNGQKSLPEEENLHFVAITLFLMASTYLAKQFFAWVRLRTLANLGEQVACDLRTHLYEHLQKLSVSFFSKEKTGSIISRISSDTDRIWDFIAFGVVEVSLSAITLLGLSGILFYLDWKLALVLIIPVPFLIFAIYFNGTQMNRLFLRCWRKWSRMTDVLSDTIPGIRVVKAFNQEEHEKAKFGRRNSAFTKEAFAVHQQWTAFWPLLILCMHVMALLVWVFALPRLVRNGPASSLSPGTFLSFLLYMGMFFQPIEIFGQMARVLNRATSSAHRIFELLDAETHLDEKTPCIQLQQVKGRVTFRNVTFGYDQVRPILKGVTFDIEEGEMIGLVGPSGAGKTTIINLIANFYEPTGGVIQIDGVDIREMDIGHYRRQIGMVLQDPYLFHGSVLENIRYGMPKASNDEVIAAAHAANAHDFVCKLPYGYDTVVGERGHTLSGGERQRVSIARAILHNPRILILDEATSSVDTETERKIQEALDRLVSGRTVFAIAHRLSTLTKANRLFVVKEGRIVEQGTHHELLKKTDGVYRKLHQMQRELHELYAV